LIFLEKLGRGRIFQVFVGRSRETLLTG